ncbi:hypothetical protein N9Y42_00070 [Mariniblastus sp.]|nr:hypothetical protein [Mariniblastus sp.]
MSNEVACWPFYLDDLSKELKRRGLPFVRYADDFVIFTNSKAAAPGLPQRRAFLRQTIKIDRQPQQKQQS